MPTAKKEFINMYFLLGLSQDRLWEQIKDQLGPIYCVMMHTTLSQLAFKVLQEPSVKPRPNDRNISTQHIPTLLGAICCEFRPNDGNISTQHIATLLGAICCVRLAILLRHSRTSTHTRVQQCCTNLAKRPQHHTTSKTVTWKIWPFSSPGQTIATFQRNIS